MKKIKIYLILSVCFFRILEASQGNTSTAQTVLSRSLVDTLNVGLEDTVNIGFFPGDIMMEVFQVPGDLTLNGVGVGVHQWNTDGTYPSLKVEVYRPDTAGYPFTSAGSMYSFGDTAESGWIGFAHSAENDSIAFPDPSSASNLVWNNFSTGTGVCSTEPEVADGQPVWGTKVLPAGNDVMISRPSGGSAGLFFVDFAGGGAQFVKDEYIAVVVTYLADGAGDPADESTRILLNAADASYLYPSPGLQYFASGCSGPSGEHGWHIMPNAWKFQYVVDITGDIPPEIDIYHVGLSTTTGLPDPIPSMTEIKVMATANDYNPSGGSEGIEVVVLHHQLNSLTADTTSEYMSTAFNLVLQVYVYHTEIPGVSNGTTVYYWVSAQDVEGNISNTNKQSYFVGTSTTDNNAPSSFTLNEQDSVYITMANFASDSIVFTWSESVDIDGDDLLYDFMAALTINGQTQAIYSSSSLTIREMKIDYQSVYNELYNAQALLAGIEWDVTVTDGFTEVTSGNGTLILGVNASAAFLSINGESLPEVFTLHQNYPNPFNPVTNIIYAMDITSDITITVHNIQGQLVKNLFIGNVKPGQHTVSWNGTDRTSQPVPSGIYIYSIKSSRQILAGKMMLLK